MDITCPACQARFALKTGRLPRTAFRVACGKCRHQFIVDPSGMGEEPDAPELSSASPPAPAPPPAPPRAPSVPPPIPTPAPAPAPAPAPGPQAARDPEAVAPAPVEEYSDDLHLSLVCEDQPERREALCAALRALGYKAHVAPRAREALAWLYQNRYEVLLLHEEFGARAEAEELLAGVRKMQMTSRRHLCVGLCGKALRTMDNMTAFHLSVNFVMAERDLPRAVMLIRNAVADNEQFYRVFKETLKQLGRV